MCPALQPAVGGRGDRLGESKMLSWLKLDLAGQFIVLLGRLSFQRENRGSQETLSSWLSIIKTNPIM